MYKNILRFLSLTIALIGLFSLVGCSSATSLFSKSPNLEGKWIAYSGYTVKNIVEAKDTPIFTMTLTAKNDIKTIYTADISAYNYQYVTQDHRPSIESTEMVGNIKEVHLKYDTALMKMISAKNILGNVDESNPNKIKMNVSSMPNSDIVYNPNTDTLQFMDQTFKRVSDSNSLQTLADDYKKDLKEASNKYLEEVGNAANPKTKFIVNYIFNDNLIKEEQ